jgi:hypothetical protein
MIERTPDRQVAMAALARLFKINPDLGFLYHELHDLEKSIAGTNYCDDEQLALLKEACVAAAFLFSHAQDAVRGIAKRLPDPRGLADGK